MKCPQYSEYNLKLNNCELEEHEKLNFYEQMNRLDCSNSQKIFRGDSFPRLLGKYQSGGIEEFNAKFFIVGPKGNAFHQEQTNRLRIDQAGVNTFELLFDWLHEFSTCNIEHSRIKGAIIKFRANNPEFTKHFSRVANKISFIEKADVLSPDDRIKVRDYYLTLLHHNSESAFYVNSFLLSVTSSFKVANGFARGHRNQQDKVIIFGWVPHENDHRVISIPFSNAGRHLNQNPVINEHGFPAYATPLFVRQREISLKGGLFVHYIIGYLLMYGDVKDFHVNPAFLNNSYDWINIGLEVDQTDFPEILGNTSLTGGYYNDGEGRFYEGI